MSNTNTHFCTLYSRRQDAVEIKKRSLTHGTYIALTGNRRKILKICSMLVKSTKEKNKAQKRER